jgi:peptidoglycan/xylan/chitin deacetylase (PgdA/CDA1 family)
VITRLPTRAREVALTFDACEAVERAQLDHGITDFLVARRVPFTVFMGGRFARDNAADVRELAQHEFVSIENHSWSHPRDMRELDDERVRSEVRRAAAMIESTTGRRTTLFRFPGGNADDRTVGLVRALGYQVVHWRWAEGDPSPTVAADRLVDQTLARTRPGDILIFHVNGRGWHTAEALPRIVDGLAARGYRFVTVAEVLARDGAASEATKAR